MKNHYVKISNAFITSVVIFSGMVLFFFNAPVSGYLAEKNKRSPQMYPDAIRIRSLIRNGRVLWLPLTYKGTRRTDTGFSRELCLVFRSSSGSRVFVRKKALAKRKFSLGRIYQIPLRFVGYLRSGPPLAELDRNEMTARIAASQYRGDIRESDPRVTEIKKTMIRGTPPPEQLRLRFQGIKGNYAVFYDLEGKYLYYKYRDDRFDRRANKKLGSLLEGQAYLVSGDFTGLLLKGKYIKLNGAEYAASLGNPNSILVYRFLIARPLRLEQILFR